MIETEQGRYTSRSVKGQRGRIFVERVAAVSRAALAYQLLVALGLAMLMWGIWTEAEILDRKLKRSDTTAFGALAFGTFISVGLGQFLAILRIRDWVLVGFCAVWYVGLGGFESEARKLIGTDLAEMVAAILLYLGPLYLLCGAWSLRVGRAFAAVWLPFMLATGGGVLIAQASKKIPTWEAGEKWLVWEPLSLAGLGLMVLVLLAFLGARERLSLTMWQQDEMAHLPGNDTKLVSPNPRLNALGWVLMGAFGLVLISSTAATAPFLWDIEAHSEGTGSDGAKSTRKTEYEDRKDRGKLRPYDEDRSGGGEGGSPNEPWYISEPHPPWFILNMLLTLLFLAVLLGYRPIRRLLWIRHLKDPFWHVTPSQRVLQGWRLIEIALADAGVKARPGEPAQLLIHRARPVLAQMAPGLPEVSGMIQAARIRDQVQYGMGVGPDDAELMQRFASRVYDTIWDRMSDLAQYRAMYRGLSLLLVRRRGLSLYDDVGQSFVQPRNLGKQLLLTGVTLGGWLGVWTFLVARDIRRLAPHQRVLPGWPMALAMLIGANWHWIFAIGFGAWVLSTLHRWRIVIQQVATVRGLPSSSLDAWKTSLLGIVYLQHRLNELGRHLQEDELVLSTSA